MPTSSEQAPAPLPRLINTAAAAEQMVTFFAGVMDELLAVLEEETALVRAGHVTKAATRLEAKKAQLAGQFFASAERFRANAKFLAQAVPGRFAALQQQHATLQSALQRNLVVLATAHAVTEGIMRRLSGEVSRRAAPQVYGASGRTLGPSPRLARPLAVSRTL